MEKRWSHLQNNCSFKVVKIFSTFTEVDEYMSELWPRLASTLARFSNIWSVLRVNG